MQIILEKEEYIKLRQNALDKNFIEQVRQIVAENNRADITLDYIKDVFTKYDRQVERQAADSENLLW